VCLYSLTGPENDGCGGKVFDDSVQCIIDSKTLFINHNNFKVTGSVKREVYGCSEFPSLKCNAMPHVNTYHHKTLY